MNAALLIAEKYGVLAVIAIALFFISMKVIEKLPTEKRGNQSKECYIDHRDMNKRISEIEDKQNSLSNELKIYQERLSFDIKNIPKELQEICRQIELQKVNISALSDEMEKLTRAIRQVIGLIIKGGEEDD